jgi:hypothetical protein
MTICENLDSFSNIAPNNQLPILINLNALDCCEVPDDSYYHNSRTWTWSGSVAGRSHDQGQAWVDMHEAHTCHYASQRMSCSRHVVGKALGSSMSGRIPCFGPGLSYAKIGTCSRALYYILHLSKDSGTIKPINNKCNGGLMGTTACHLALCTNESPM